MPAKDSCIEFFSFTPPRGITGISENSSLNLKKLFHPIGSESYFFIIGDKKT